MATRTNPHSTTRLVPAKGAARETGIPYSSLRDAVHRGELPVVKLASAWYFERRDLDNWIESLKERA
jgi:excisionase family DNA binding protein